MTVVSTILGLSPFGGAIVSIGFLIAFLGLLTWEVEYIPWGVAVMICGVIVGVL